MEGQQNIAAVELSARIASAADAIVFYHKEHCPHCKNMEKVLEKFAKKQPSVAIYAVDSNEDPVQMETYGVERVPSLMFIKGGKVIHVKTGLLNPRELAELYSTLSA